MAIPHTQSGGGGARAEGGALRLRGVRLPLSLRSELTRSHQAPPRLRRVRRPDLRQLVAVITVTTVIIRRYHHSCDHPPLSRHQGRILNRDRSRELTAIMSVITSVIIRVIIAVIVTAAVTVAMVRSGALDRGPGLEPGPRAGSAPTGRP